MLTNRLELKKQCLDSINIKEENLLKEEKNIKMYMETINKRIGELELKQALLCRYINIDSGTLSDFLSGYHRKHKVPLRYAFWLVVAISESYDDARMLMGQSGNKLTCVTQELCIAEAIFECFSPYNLQPSEKLEIVYELVYENEFMCFL